MKFFNIDFHISVIADIRSLLGQLGHRVDSLNLSNHTWVFGWEKDRVPSLDGMSTSSFGQRECDRFYQMERERLAEYDGFIVTHTPCLAGLYEMTGKPVICVVSARYDGFCHTPESMAWLDDKLRVMHHRGQLILLANNAYDAWHVDRNVGIRPEIVPSVCDYTGVKWGGGKAPPFLAGRVDVPGLRRLPAGHSWQDVADAASCVVVPYNASLMSVFERHAMGMPMLMPSGLWTLLHWETLTELTYSGSPDSRDLEAAATLSDWHSEELPGITFFDRVEDIPGLLAQGVPPTNSQEERKARVLSRWQEVLRETATLRSAMPSMKCDNPGGIPGFWKWHPNFTGELREDGALVQMWDGNRAVRLGSWMATPDGFEMVLTDCWRKRVVLSMPGSGVWYLNGESTPGGAIRKLGRNAPSWQEGGRTTLNCDSYAELADTRIFVLHTDSVATWHEKLRPSHGYILITCHSDSQIDGRFMEVLADPLLVHWYALNVMIRHPKLSPIPIGGSHRLMLDSWLRDGKAGLIPPLYDILLAEGAVVPKGKLFNMSFDPGTNRPQREACLNACRLDNRHFDQAEFLVDLAESRFCLAPEGNGVDTMRVWEALYCRSVPIITWNPMVDMGLYDGLPVIVLDRWEDFRKEDFTEERYERLMRGFDPACLSVDRWIPNADELRKGRNLQGIGDQFMRRS